MDTQEFLKQRRDTHALVRRASDKVRSHLIPKLAAEKIALLDSYLRINRHHFEHDVRLGQMAQADSAYRFTISKDQDPYYQTTLDELANLRHIRGNVGGFEVLHPAFVQPLAAEFFKALERHEPFTTETSFIHYLAIADFALQLLHPVKDGTGRTGEDILVQLGLLCERPLTFSLTGYRASLDGSDRFLFHRHVTERLGHIEFVKAFMVALGVPKRPAYPTHVLEVLDTLIKTYTSRSETVQSWQNRLTDDVEKLSAEIMRQAQTSDPLLTEGHPYFEYASFFVKEVCYLILCLNNASKYIDGLVARYPLSMGCRILDFKTARGRAYAITSEGVGLLVDQTMAKIDLARLGMLEPSAKDFENLIARINNDVFSKLLTVESKSPSMEKLLERVSIQRGWGMTPQEFRTTLDAEMNWAL